MPKLQISIPDDYLCPITKELMLDPVATSDGQIYERKAIEKWLQDHDTSPVTNLNLKNKELTIVPFVKKQIQAFLEKNNLYTQKEFFEAINKAVIERSPLYKIQKLNYLNSYLEAKNDFNGFTLLHIAASAGHVDLVAWLLAEEANAQLKDNNGSTPLHVAKNAEIAKLLLAEGANLNGRNNKGETPLHCAAARGRAEVVKLLLNEGADSQAKDNQGYTPEDLHETIASLSLLDSPQYDRIKYLLLINKPHFELECGSPLHLAIFYDQVDEVKVLFWLMHEQGESIDLELKDKRDWTPLNLAVSRGLVEVVKLLLAEKVNLNTKTCFLGKLYTPLHHAVSKGHKEIVQLLLEQDADVNALDQNNLTPVQLAERNGNIEIVKLFQLYEAPKRIAQLEKFTQQQNQLIQQMQTQITELTLQLQQLIREHQPTNSETKKNYLPVFNFSNKK